MLLEKADLRGDGFLGKEKGMKYQVQEVAKISGVSIRTLHYYDEVGLLCPEKAENGYRLYDEEQLNRLQMILYYKFLGFSLKNIKELMIISPLDRLTKLKEQLSLLKKEERKIKKLVKTLEKTIEEEKGEEKMSVEEKFLGFTLKDHRKYRGEASIKYGERTILEAEQKQAGKEETMIDEFNQLFFAFAKNKENKIDASSEGNVNLAKKLHEAICTYGFHCSKEVFRSIGKGYVADKRFHENIEKFGEGVAQYIFDAIESYVTN